MRIAFVHYPGRLARLEAARAGSAPTEFLFGAIELERAGHEISHFEVDPRAPINGVAVRSVDGLAGRGLLPPHLAAAPLRDTRPLLSTLRGADVVVATTTGTAVALASWRAAGLLARPLVGIVAGLVNHPWRRSRRATTLLLLRRMHAVVYGDGELGVTLERAPGLAGRVHVNPFGVDLRFWTASDATAFDGVLAIGTDGHRDWDTLVRAAPEIPAPVRVFTSHRRPAALPGNVSWASADWHRQVLSDPEVRDLYRRTSAVVVPVRDVPQPSGQSVSLQAMACGRPVVLSRTRGLWARESLHDGENVILVPPADPAALAGAVRAVLEDPQRASAIGVAARAHVERHAPIEAFADRLLRICHAAVERP
jgi:glycosyltransferase involved in cell wall biosynthesis